MRREITNIEELKSIQLGIMDYVHAFCVDNNITYYLAYGSLIGAIRHDGFIPWDDDIDLWMPREDYAKFCQLFNQKKTTDFYEIVNSETAKYYGRAMSKVIDTRTVLYEPTFCGDDPIGVNIDIWPLDGINEKNVKTTMIKSIIIHKLLYARITKLNACKGIAGKLAHIVLCAFPPKLLVEKQNRFCKRVPYAESRKVASYTDPYYKIYLKEWFGSPKLHRFEEKAYYIPEHPEKILSSIYGEFMKLPPIEEQTPHHVVNAFWI